MKRALLKNTSNKRIHHCSCLAYEGCRHPILMLKLINYSLCMQEAMPIVVEIDRCATHWIGLLCLPQILLHLRNLWGKADRQRTKSSIFTHSDHPLIRALVLEKKLIVRTTEFQWTNLSMGHWISTCSIPYWSSAVQEICLHQLIWIPRRNNLFICRPPCSSRFIWLGYFLSKILLIIHSNWNLPKLFQKNFWFQRKQNAVSRAHARWQREI